jgi:hypothetical protein
LADITNNLRNINSNTINNPIGDTIGNSSFGEVVFLAARIQEVARIALQAEREQGMEHAIEFEKLRKALKSRDDEIQALALAKDSEIGGLL